MASLTLPEVQAIQTILNTYKSQRARIMGGMKELMKTITTSRGYTHEVSEVSFNVKGWREKSTPQTPTIFIIDTTTQLVTRAAGRTRQYRQFIELFGVLREKTIIEFEEFISDIEVAIKDNNTLFGQVNFMEVLDVTTDNQLFSELDGTHLFGMTVEVNYTRCFDEPR